MKKTIVILGMSLVSILSYAQPKVSNLDAYPSGQSIALTYNLSEDANVSFYVSENGGKTFRKLSAQYLSGECGSRVKAGEYRKALWHVLDENNNEDFRGDVQFKVKALPCFNPFVLAMGAISGTKDWNVGLMAGMCGVAGFYVKGSTNFSAIKQCDYTCGKDGLINYQGEQVLPFYSGKKVVNNWMVTAGAMVRLYIPLYLYLGGGYGQRELYWEMSDNKWVNNLAGQYKGFCGDIGLMGNIHHFAISVGISTIQFKYMEINVGLGYMF